MQRSVLFLASMMRLTLLVLLLVMVVGISAVLSPRAYLPLVTKPVVTPPPWHGVPAFRHIFIIVMENHEYGSVIGSAAAPYFNGLAQRYGLATNSYAIRHPSLPNYLVLTGGSTFSITNDCTNCFINAVNLVGHSLWQNLVAGAVILVAVVVDRLFDRHSRERT